MYSGTRSKEPIQDIQRFQMWKCATVTGKRSTLYFGCRLYVSFVSSLAHYRLNLFCLCRNCWIDLRPYSNTACYTVNETASIQRTYRLFRTLGLRFLCVVNHNNQVVGCISRKDLLTEALTDSLLRGRNAHANKDDEREVT